MIFIGVGTPEKRDGSANLKYVYAVAGQIAETAERDCVVVVKSTVPIGTNDKLEEFLQARQTHPVRLEVASNPEFLSQGTAVRDTLHPSRIVIGAVSYTHLDVYKRQGWGRGQYPVPAGTGDPERGYLYHLQVPHHD